MMSPIAKTVEAVFEKIMFMFAVGSLLVFVVASLVKARERFLLLAEQYKYHCQRETAQDVGGQRLEGISDVDE